METKDLNLGTVVTEKDMVRKKDGSSYSREEYRNFPDRF